MFVKNIWKKLLLIVRNSTVLHNHNQVASAPERTDFEAE
jgi:hypothetical protein